MKYRPRHAIHLTAITAVALGACSPGPGGEGDPAVVTMRVWDGDAADAYERSFEKFTAAHPDIRVQTEVVPWADYWIRLAQDLEAGTMADIFWTNSTNFGAWADAGALIDISAALGEGHDEWNEPVTEIYTREGRLWGVPQLVDSIALFYNKELLEAADVDVTALEWSPDPAADTLTPALVELTVDDEGNHPGEEAFDPDDVAVWGFNAQNDLQAIWLGFLVQNGGEFQDGDTYTFDSPAGVEAFEYLVDLINAHGVAPPAELTNDDANASRDLFARGELALLQTGQYALEEVARIDSFEWGIAPLIEGPRGRVGVVHGVAAVGNAASSRSQATSEALAWLGSAEGQRPLGEAGVGLPAALGAAATFTDYWDARGVDASEFVTAASGPAAPAPVGRRSNAGLDALATVLPEMFEGRVPVAQALEQAQQAANEAIAD